jgi:hypothetical protein
MHYFSSHFLKYSLYSNFNCYSTAKPCEGNKLRKAIGAVHKLRLQEEGVGGQKKFFW